MVRDLDPHYLGLDQDKMKGGQAEQGETRERMGRTCFTLDHERRFL